VRVHVCANHIGERRSAAATNSGRIDTTTSGYLSTRLTPDDDTAASRSKSPTTDHRATSMPLICARVEGSDRSVNVRGSFTAIDDRSCDDGGFAGAAFNRPATEKKHRRAACPPAAAAARGNCGE